MNAPAVELLQFLPMIPPLNPGTTATAALSIPGGSLSAPVWLPEAQALAVLNNDQQALVRPGEGTIREPESLPLPPQSSSAVSAHAILGEGALATCGGPSRSLACVLADPPSVVALPLEGAEELTGVGLVCPLSNARLLVGTDTGSLVCLSKDAPPVTLISGFAPGSLKGACLSSDEKKLYLCDGQAVACCALDVDGGTCSPPAALPQLAASLGEAAVSGGVTGVACDVNGNLYVSAASGVLVVDDTGDAMVKLPIPNGASGLCFGGPSFSELFVTSGDFVWRVKTNTQGVQPPSAEFIKWMEKLTASGDYRHVGW